LNFVTCVTAVDEIDIIWEETCLKLASDKKRQRGTNLEDFQQYTVNGEHLPGIDETHSDDHSTPTDDDEDRKLAVPILQIKRLAGRSNKK